MKKLLTQITFFTAVLFALNAQDSSLNQKEYFEKVNSLAQKLQTAAKANDIDTAQNELNNALEIKSLGAKIQNEKLAALAGATKTNEDDFAFEANDDITEITITGYNGNDETVVVPSHIQGIPVVEVFGSYHHRKVVIFPEGIKRIYGSYRELEKVLLPNSLEEIGSGVFEGTNLQNIVIPDGVKVLPLGTFYDCRLLTNITLSEGLEEIGAQVFEGCDNLRSIQLPSSLKELHLSAFKRTGITELSFPENVKLYVSSSDWSEVVTTLYLPKSMTFSTNHKVSSGSIISVTIPEGAVYYIESGETCKTLADVIPVSDKNLALRKNLLEFHLCLKRNKNFGIFGKTQSSCPRRFRDLY